MTTKNNALPTEVGEAETDMVLENNEAQVPEDANLVREVCETETVKEIPSPGYEEFGEPPKTETEQQQKGPEAPKIPTEQGSGSHTEAGNEYGESTGKNEGEEDLGVPETEMENPEKTLHHGKEFPQFEPFSQTDRELRDVISGGMVDSGVITGTDLNLVEKDMNAGQNSVITEETVKPKRKRSLLKLGRKTKEELEQEVKEEKKPKKSPSKTKAAAPETDTERKPDAGDGATRSEEKKKKRASVKPVQEVMTIDGERSVQTDDDKAKNDLLDLLESLKSGKVLTGIIQGVERTEKGNEPFAVIYHGVYKVIIPATELVDEPTDYRGLKPKDVMHYLITKRLGAEIDYVIKGVEQKSGVAVASRKEAMKSKRKFYYFGRDRDGNNLMYPGICAEARVVSVIRSGIFVDVFGVETYVSLKELSYQRVMDALHYYQAGQRVIVKILDIDRTDKNNVKVKASVKQAGENPYEKALRKYTVGNCYVGTVSLVDTTGVFVALDGGIDCLCSYPKRGRPPRGARVTVRVLGINHDSNRIWGAITHIAMPR